MRHYQKGRKHFEKDDYVRAHACFDEALNLRFNDRGLARKLGSALLEAAAAIERQKTNRAKAEGHRAEGRQYHEQAITEASPHTAGSCG